MSRRRLPAASAALVLTALTACSPAEVPQLSTSADPNPSSSASVPASGGELAWSIDIGVESWSQPGAVGDLVVFGANDGVVRAINSGDGSEAWRVATDGPVRGGVTVADSIAYVVSDDGALYAIDARGEVAWTASLGTSVAERTDYDNYGSAPAVGGGVVYAATQSGHVGAVSVATGELLWSVDVGAPVESGLALGEGRVHVSTMGNRHIALSTDEGSLVWELPTGAPATTTPLVMGEYVVVGSRSANIQVRAEATGEKTWTTSLGGSWVQSGGAAISPTSFAIGSSDYKAVRGFDVATGEGLWLTKVGGWTWAVPVVADNVVYASEIRLDYQLPWDTALWAIDATTGDVLWTAGAGEALEWAPDGYGAYGNGAGPVIVQDLVVVSGLDGVVRAYKR